MTAKKKVVLVVVEDEVMLLQALTERLGTAGFEVHGHTSAPKALEHIIEEQPDLVMTDIIMEPMDGLDLIAQLQEHDATKDIPTIVLTNSNELAHVQKAKALKVAEFIVKADHSLEEIAQKVAKTLED